MDRVRFVCCPPEPEASNDGRKFRDLVGTPTRAEGCSCRVGLVDEPGGSCCRCGRCSEGEIRLTWTLDQ